MSEKLTELVDKVLKQYHQKHRADFDFLIPLAFKVESVHAEKTDCPAGLADFLTYLKGELEMHMQKEEQVLFPMIKSGQGISADGPINVMMSEHVEHENNLTKLKKLAKDFKLPDEACGSWKKLYEGVETLTLEISEHIDFENNTLFPKALKGEESSCCGSCT